MTTDEKIQKLSDIIVKTKLDVAKLRGEVQSVISEIEDIKTKNIEFESDIQSLKNNYSILDDKNLFN